MDRVIAELAFWDKVYTEKKDWIKSLLNPVQRHLCMPPEFIKAIQLVNKRIADALDVGCGPISCLLAAVDRKLIRLMGIDPLAEEYGKILKRHGVTAPATLKCRGESLDLLFGADEFDIVHARNSLDHTENPRAVMLNINLVLRKGGYFVLVSKIDEGTTANWHGMHQWNLHLDGDIIILANQAGVTMNLMDELPFKCIEHTTNGQWFSGIWQKV